MYALDRASSGVCVCVCVYLCVCVCVHLLVCVHVHVYTGIYMYIMCGVYMYMYYTVHVCCSYMYMEQMRYSTCRPGIVNSGLKDRLIWSSQGTCTCI